MATAKGGGQGGRGHKPGSHRKGAQAGSGGQRRRGLSGKGPTPAAEQRKGHPATRRAAASARAEGAGQRVGRGPAGQRGGDQRGGDQREGRSRGGRPSAGSAETVAGRNAVLEALQAGVPATACYVAERIDADDRVREALRLANRAGVPLLEAPRAELDRLTSGAVHQGLALRVPAYDYAHPDDLLARAFDTGRSPLIVALDGITDPRNLGAVVRSAAAFGAHGILVPERRAAGMTAGAWKASAGAAARVPVARATNLTRALQSYRRAGLLVVGLAADGELDLAALEAAVDPMVLVIGSEGRGLSRLVSETCDLIVRIPIEAASESINAGVAAGIVLYEVARRRSG